MPRKLIGLSRGLHNDILQNLTDLDQLPTSGFKLSMLPIKWVNTTAALMRAVAIFEDLG